jgi:hypothetical protein
MLLDLLANQPPDFFHDSFGQFVINVAVAVLVGIVTAVIAIWVFRKQCSKKEISYQIISDVPIASISKGFEKRVTIQLDGKPVKELPSRQLCNDEAMKQDWREKYYRHRYLLFG